MFASIRIYRGAVSVPKILRQVEVGFVPILKRTTGFRSWQVIDSSGGQLVSISIFDHAEEALAANELAESWIRDNVADLLPEAPDIVTGQVVRSATLASGLR